jgi:DNA modification methylase
VSEDEYAEDAASGRNWTLRLGDSCELLPRLPDECIDLSVYSPPFSSLYTYSPSLRDIGNCRSEEEFLEHYGFVIREMLRVTKPGRLSCVHAADITRLKSVHGNMSLHDLPGDIIRAHVAAGWLYFGRVMVDKNPQAQAIRTHSHALLFKTKNKDSAKCRPAIGDSLLVFKKPGDGVPVLTDCTNEEWIQWAHPVWYGIRESNTLNGRVARESADERHIAPLQLDFIERCVRLYSNKGETVLSPFAGIGSEVWAAVKLGRRGIGIELKESYWRLSVKYLTELEASPPEETPAPPAMPVPQSPAKAKRERSWPRSDLQRYYGFTSEEELELIGGAAG